MSIQAMAWSLQQQLVTDPTARHVLLCLANYAGQDGTGAFPSVDTLCTDTGLRERTVRAKLSDLESAGAIRRGAQALAAVYVGRADRRPVVWDIVMRGAADAPRPAEAPCGQVCGQVVGQIGHGVHLTAPRGAPRAPNPRALSEQQEKGPRVDKSELRKAEARGLADARAALGGVR